MPTRSYRIFMNEEVKHEIQYFFLRFGTRGLACTGTDGRVIRVTVGHVSWPALGRPLPQALHCNVNVKVKVKVVHR